MTYNQVTGKLITAYFRNNKIYRNDVDGNVQTIYYMQEDDSPEPVGLMSIQSGAATYYIDNNTVEGITYRNQPVYSIFPMDKIPETQALFLEDFKWEGHRRPALREVFDRTIRPSERAEKSALPRPDFPITRRIEEYKKLLIESGTWVDRDDKLTPEALEWLHWLGYWEGRFVRSVRNSFVLGGRGEDMRYFCSPNQKTVLRTRRIVELRSGPKNAKVAKEIPYSGVRSRR